MDELVGRERELRLLRSAFDAARQRKGSLVLVSGEAGIGKTSLVQAIVSEAREQDALVLSGAAYDLSTTPPYGPWFELTDRYRPDSDLPELPDVLSCGTSVGDLPSQLTLFEIARNFLIAVSEARPLVVVLEDLHWSDQASLDMLRYVTRWIGEQRILLIVTYRDDEITSGHPLYRLLPLLVREGMALRIDLRPLPRDAVQALLRGIYALSSEDERRLTDYLLAHTEGNPLYVREVLRMLEEQENLELTPVGWQLGSLRRATVPRLIRQVIERRLALLSDDTRRMLQIAAVIGSEVPLDFWQSLAGAAEDDMGISINEAVEAHVVDEWEDIGGVTFTHALIREALHTGIALPERRTWHRRAAEVLLDLLEPDADVVAYHFQQAGDLRAADWLARAGDRAARRFAPLAAVERFQAALSLNEGNPLKQQENGWISLRIAIESRELDPRFARERIEASKAIAASTGDKALAAMASFHSGQNRFIVGENGFDELEKGLWALQALSPDDLDTIQAHFPGFDSSLLDASQALMHALFGQYHHAIVIAQECIASSVHENRFTNNERGHAWLALALSYRALGKPEAARDAFAKMHAHYRNAGNTWLAAIAGSLELQELILVYYPDDAPRRRKVIQDIGELWTQSSGFATTLPPKFGLLPSLIANGDWEEACELARPYADRDVIHHNVALRTLGIIAKDQGKVSTAWEYVKTCIPDGPDTVPGSTWLVDILEMHRLAVELAIDEGDPHLGRRWLEAHDRWLVWSNRIQGRAESLLLWARIKQVEGDSESARDYANQALIEARSPRQPTALIEIHRFLGELATQARDFKAAESNLQSSLELTEQCAFPFERALTLLAVAELEAARQRLGEARRLLIEVRRICTELGARPTLERADKLLARFQPRQSELPSGLSPRELDVLRLIVQGMPDKDIANKLFISHHTVMRHVSHILAKLDVDSRTAAAAKSIREGIC